MKDPLIKKKQLACTNVHYFCYPLESAFQCQHEAEYETVELYGGTPHFWLDSHSWSDCRVIKRLARKYSLNPVAFTPEFASFHHTLCIDDSEWREKSLLFYENAVCAASELEVPLLVINAVGAFRDQNKEDTWNRVGENLIRICRIAEREGIILAMETVPEQEHGFISTAEELNRLIGQVGSRALKVTLDICSAAAAGETIKNWFKIFDRDIVHIHFSDGRPSGHMVWGDGILPCEDLLHNIAAAGYEGNLGLELANYDYYDEPGSADHRNMERLRLFT